MAGVYVAGWAAGGRATWRAPSERAVVVYVFVRFFTGIMEESGLEVTACSWGSGCRYRAPAYRCEVHDSIAQTSFYLTVKLHEIDDLVLDGESEETHSELQVVRRETKAAYHPVERLSQPLGNKPGLRSTTKRWVAQ
jgi:hypothetical protein